LINAPKFPFEMGMKTNEFSNSKFGSNPDRTEYFEQVPLSELKAMHSQPTEQKKPPVKTMEIKKPGQGLKDTIPHSPVDFVKAPDVRI
jgi:hypothetical protein